MRKLQNILSDILSFVPEEIAMNEIAMILLRYETPEGAVYLRSISDVECEGITDTKGNYLYIRLNGNISADKDFEIYPLRLVLCLPFCSNIDEIMQFLSYYLREELPSKGASMLPNTVTELNKQIVFTSETGRKIKEQKSEIALAYLDFSVKLKKQINYICVPIKCNNC